MRKLLNHNLISEFAENVDDLSSKQVSEIVSTPFAYLKERMADGGLPTIRLKYFGTFVVYRKRAEHILRRTEQQFEKGTINQKEYDRRKKMLVTFLEDESN